MPITDMLGTSNSMLGNMSFGEGTTYQGQVFNKSANNTLSLSQALARSITSLHSPSSALSLTNVVVEAFQGRGSATNTLTLVGTVGVHHYWKIGVGQSIFISQSVGAGASYRRSLSQSLTLTEVANLSRNISVSQSLTLTSASIASYSKFASNTLALTDTVKLTKSISRLVTSTLSLTKNVGLSKSVEEQLTSLFAPSQSTNVVHGRAQAASNTLTLTQEMYRTRTNENEPQSLAISQVVAVKKIKNISVHQTLTFNQAGTYNGTPIMLSVTQTLVFKQSHDRATGISSMPIVTIPSGYVVKVPDVRPADPCYPYRGKLTLLEIPGTSVILPTAEFNDTQSYNGRVSIKRAMSGKRRVYHRKMGIAQKLHYDFIIDRRKAMELRQFIIQANSIPIKLTNWKGEVWQVLLTNSPLTFTEESYWGPGSGLSSGNKSSISLEFEGARIN